MMTAQTVGNAVATRETTPASMIEEYRGDFAQVLPSHVKADQWVRVAVGLTRRNDKAGKALREAAATNPGSFMAALLDCARLGLEPGDTYHLVPFGGEVTGIVDYTGEIELIYRAGAVSSVKAEIVYSKDRFEYRPDMDRPVHEIDWFAADGRGDMIGVYAYAVMADGATSKVVVMSKAAVEKVKAVSKTAHRSDSPWKQWPDRMWLKTAVHQLKKWVPTSAEYRREQLRAAVDAQRVAEQHPALLPHLPPPVDEVPPGVLHRIDQETGEITDAEVVDDPQPAETPETPGVPVTRPQLTKLHASFTELGYGDRDDRLRAVATLVGHPVSSTQELTKPEATNLIEVLGSCLAHPDPQGALLSILEAEREGKGDA
jgi:recombination protein RecT